MARNDASQRSSCAWLVVGLVLCLFVPGCGGCTPQDPAEIAKAKKEREEAEKKKKLEKPKPDYESADLVIEPGESKATSNVVKPGHWVAASKAFKANNNDLPAADIFSAPVDMAGNPLEAEHTPFRLVMSRPVSLSKGQTKHFEFLYYIPRKVEGMATTVRLQNIMTARGGGRELYHPGDEPTLRMPAYQFHLLVLATDPDRYGFLKRLETIHPSGDELDEQTLQAYYRIDLPKLEKRVPLPSQALAWTSLAFLFWDGIDPNLLTPDQQQHLIDWLHWGGQLVVSGPESLDTLRGSFLGEYLPAEKVKALELEQAAFDGMNGFWSLKDKKGVKRDLEVVAGKPPIGVELALTERGEFLPHTGDLVAEARIGRGRIAVTAFSLTSRALVNWPCLDNFYNTALLRRPAREYTASQFGDPTANWIDYPGGRADPRLVSTVRYFSRDIGYLTGTAPKLPATPQPPPINTPPINGIHEEPREELVLHPDVNDWHFDGYTKDNESGVAGWNDICAAADAARASLKDAAGIKIPKADFVVKVLAIYLLVLVPVNWAVFRLLGRVEWAWIAAPIIALVGAGVVVRTAQLDIGFVRSQTEINIVEAHAGHARGHVTRYAALYSSLSTNYDIHFDDASAIAQPFPTAPRAPQNAFNRETPKTCYFRRENGVTLNGFLVRSNKTDFVHSEQMLPLGGAFQLRGSPQSGWQLENDSDFAWQEAAVLRCVEKDQYEVAYLGQLNSKTKVPLNFTATGKAFLPDEWRESAVLSPTAARSKDQLSLWRLAELASKQLRLDPGDFRLLGWSDQAIPGMRIEPAAPQVSSLTLAIVHLREAPLPPLVSDKNMRISLTDDAEKKEDDAPDAPPAEAPPS